LRGQTYFLPATTASLKNRIIPGKEKIMEKGEKAADGIEFICKADLKPYIPV
jgi:hypothetical protein